MGRRCSASERYPRRASLAENADRMSQSAPRFTKLFFEVYESLPRQGPGSRACAARALGLCRDLPRSPVVLDLGCGVGGQTLQLAGFLESASITAIDAHAPSIERLRAASAKQGLVARVSAFVGDMDDLRLPHESFDLVWSEGALYNLGLHRALRVCWDLLRPGGYLAFTDAVWRKEDRPAEVRAGFEVDYPTMGSVGDDLAAIGESGFELVGHFTLPDEAWWDDFYAPMEERIRELREAYRGDSEALAVLDALAEEPAVHRRHGDCYAYEFFVVRRPLSAPRVKDLSCGVAVP